MTNTTNWKIGDRFEITLPTNEGYKKADSGTFEITLAIPQPDGNTFFHWTRVGARGKVSASVKNTSNTRCGRASYLTRIEERGYLVRTETPAEASIRAYWANSITAQLQSK